MELFQCQSCSKQFRKLQLYNQHQNTHSKPHRCNQCQKGFGLRTDLRRHERSRHHVAQQMYSCTAAECDFEATRKDNLAQHIRRTHKFASNLPSELRNTVRHYPAKPYVTVASFAHEKFSISIFDAAAAGNIALLEQLHEVGVDLFEIAADGSNALHAAATATSSGAIQYLLSMGVRPNDCNKMGRTPLQEAARAGNWENMSVLLSREIIRPPATILGSYLVQSENLHAIAAFIEHYGRQVIDQGDEPLLHVAVNRKCVAVLRRLLIHRGLNINARDRSGSAVLHHAAKVGITEILQLLLAYPGIDVNARRETHRLIDQDTPLFIAVRRGHEVAVRILLSHDNIQFAGGKSWPMHEIIKSASHRQYQTGQVLIKDSRVQNNDAVNPLLRAIARGHEHKIIDLLQKDVLAATYTLEEKWLAPLSWALALGHRTIAKRLMDVPAIDVNYGEYGFTPIEIAAANGDSDSLLVLLGHPSFLSGGSSVYEAVRRGHPRALELLLSNERIDPNRKQPLVTATENGSIEMVKMLLDCPRIDVNEKSWRSYDTALTAAVWRGNLDIIWLLLKHEGRSKININAPTGRHRESTALDIAIRQNATEIVEILRSLGAKTRMELKETQESQNSVEVTSNEHDQNQVSQDIDEGPLDPYSDFLRPTSLLPEGLSDDDEDDMPIY